MVNQQYTNKNNLQNDPTLQRILARIPAKISTTFTDAQLAELKKVFVERSNNSSPVDIRLSIPFFQRRFYLLLLAGKERRSLERLKKSNFKVINTFVGTTYILAMMTIILLGSVYLIQEKLRIDSFQSKPVERIREYLPENH